MIKLRNYQQKLYDNARRELIKGYKRPLIVSPCGSGKTYLFAAMAENCNGDVLILTHRKELKNQTEKILKDNNITNARVAMVLTENNHLGEHGQPKMIITDERHLSRSNTWVNVLNYYNTYTMGFTRTPVRLDGKPLGDIYDTLVDGVSVNWLIENNYLSPYEYYAPFTVNTDNVSVQRGDYVISELEQLMSSRAIYSNAIESYKKIANGEKTIIYCVSVKHAKETAERFKEAGYNAVELDGTVPEKQREQIMADFRSGKYTILCNVGIISEGVSIDDVTCCMLLRPTESLRLFWQQGQRCMRYLPGKTRKILDCVGNYTRNPLWDSNVEWSLESALKKHTNIKANGDFAIRTCPKCFRRFKTRPVCPYCGTEYPLSQRELDIKEEIELKKIKRAELELAEQNRKQLRKQQGSRRTYEELVRIGKQRGYANAGRWAYHVLRGRK